MMNPHQLARRSTTTSDIYDICTADFINIKINTHNPSRLIRVLICSKERGRAASLGLRFRFNRRIVEIIEESCRVAGGGANPMRFELVTEDKLC